MLTNEEMVRFAVVDARTAIVVRTGRTDTDCLASSAGDDDIVSPVPEWVEDQKHRYEWSSMEWIALPEKPGPWAEWDGQQWTDPRTEDDIAAEVEAAQHARRTVASLTRLEFAKRVSHPETGFIQPSSGMILLDGDVPPELQPMVASLPPPDQFALIMDLKGAMQFDRLNPFVVSSGRFLGLTDEQMDAVFGI